MIRPALRGAAVAAALMLASHAAHAQAHAGHGAMPHHADTAAHRMTTPCPLHLGTLGLTPAQDSAVARIRAAHMAGMKSMHAGHAGDSAAHRAAGPAMQAQMKEAMGRAVAELRTVLDDAQEARLDAAIAAHDAEKAERAKAGKPHDCAACCGGHDAHHGTAAAKHEH